MKKDFNFKTLDDSEQLAITYDEPLDQGYIILPISILKKAKTLTKKFSIVPNIFQPNNKENRRMLTLLLTIDMLNKEEIPVTLKTVSQTMGVSIDSIRELMQSAVDDEQYKCIERAAKELKWKINHKRNNIKLKAVVQAPNKVKRLIDYHYEAYTKKYGTHPNIDERDGIEAQRLCEEYSYDQLCQLHDEYIECTDVWPKSHELKHLRRNISKLNFNRMMAEKARRQKKVYDPQDYAKEITDEDLKDYLVSKLDGRWTGNEEWAQGHEQELKSRGITEKELTDDDYERARKAAKVFV